MDRVERQLVELEDEMRALKRSFAQSATGVAMYKYEQTFSTSRNAQSYTNSQSFDVTKFPLCIRDTGNETMVVTFRSKDGRNALATLDIDMVTGDPLGLNVRRVPFDGGARWQILNLAGGFTAEEWVTTTYKFTVNTMAEGTLDVRMIWQ